jgi:hypothetical protein
MPYPGDNGVTFAPKPGMEKAFNEWMAFFNNPSVEKPQRK